MLLSACVAPQGAEGVDRQRLGGGAVEAKASPGIHFHTFRLFIYCLYNLLSRGFKYYRLPRENQNVTVRRGLNRRTKNISYKIGLRCKIFNFWDFLHSNTRLVIFRKFFYERKCPDIVGMEIHVIFCKIYNIANTYSE